MEGAKMDKMYVQKVNDKVKEIIKSHEWELNGEETRRKIAYEIKCFLDKESIEWETLNNYTSPETIDKGLVDIEIDDIMFPLEQHKGVVKKLLYSPIELGNHRGFGKIKKGQ